MDGGLVLSATPLYNRGEMLRQRGVDCDKMEVEACEEHDFQVNNRQPYEVNLSGGGISVTKGGEHMSEEWKTLEEAGRAIGATRWQVYSFVRLQRVPQKRVGNVILVRLSDLQGLAHKVNAKQTA